MLLHGIYQHAQFVHKNCCHSKLLFEIAAVVTLRWLGGTQDLFMDFMKLHVTRRLQCTCDASRCGWGEAGEACQFNVCDAPLSESAVRWPTHLSVT